MEEQFLNAPASRKRPLLLHNQEWINTGFLSGFSSLNICACSSSANKRTQGFSWNSKKVLICFFFALLFGPAQVSCDSCLFPARWMGLWFQKGTQDPIRIFNGTISNKGTCRDVDGDKFLIQSTLENCYRCVVLHEKHINVLQYKETFCSVKSEHESLNLCNEFNGDALLFSMFRLQTPAVPCPFRGSYTFTYSRGLGVCGYPVSTVDSCTEDSHLRFRFQACADVPGSESRMEDLVCLATWKEGSARYLVGKLEHKVAKADEDKFRCFVYEQMENGTGYYVAQSGDATCDGLFTAYEGSRTMQLKKASHHNVHCHFPDWFTVYHHWRVLDGRLAYDILRKNGLFRVSNATTGDVVKSVVCVSESLMTHLPTTMMSTTTTSATPGASAAAVASSGVGMFAQFVVHVTYGCNSGYTCMRLHKRAPHVVEIQTGSTLSNSRDDVCRSDNWEVKSSEIVTLTTLSAGSLECPLAGIYSMEGNHVHLSRLISLDMEEISLCAGTTTLTSGCSARDQMELMHDCSTQKKVKTFQCRGSWEENGTNYVIATAVGTRRHLCLVYTENDKTVHFSGSIDACLRGVHPGREGLIALNGTNKGMCMSTNSSTRAVNMVFLIGIFSALIALLVTKTLR